METPGDREVKINCFQMNNDGTLESDDPDACLERWRAGKGRYWLDIQGSEVEERMRWLKALDLRPLDPALLP